MALDEKRASGALEAVQRQALMAIQRTAGEVAKRRAEADQVEAKLQCMEFVFDGLGALDDAPDDASTSSASALAAG